MDTPASPRTRPVSAFGHRRLLVAALAAAVSLAAACGPPRDRQEAALSIAGALSGDTTGYARADAPRPFHFPADHGPHPRFRTEWWYFTGNLDGADGRRFGYQLTFFRNALAPPDDEAAAFPTDDRASPWATRQAWFAHFAVTDAAGRRFFAAQRLARGGRLGLAGATFTGPGLRLWVDDWSARSVLPVGTAPPAIRGGGLLPLRLAAAQEGAAIALTLEPGKPVVLQGDSGLSVKSRDPATGMVDASYYYSFTRLPTAGTVTLGEGSFAVSGSSWMDREWSTSALAQDQVGWDWFALQLDDGRDLMVYALRLSDAVGGGIDPASSATLVARDGTARHLARDAFAIDVLDRWRSPATGALYPFTWHLAVPGEGIDLVIRPVLADQELDVGLRYWEGAVDVRRADASREGSAGAPVIGRGYVELTGYGPGMPR